MFNNLVSNGLDFGPRSWLAVFIWVITLVCGYYFYRMWQERNPVRMGFLQRFGLGSAEPQWRWACPHARAWSRSACHRLASVGLSRDAGNARVSCWVRLVLYAKAPRALDHNRTPATTSRRSRESTIRCAFEQRWCTNLFHAGGWNDWHCGSFRATTGCYHDTP